MRLIAVVSAVALGLGGGQVSACTGPGTTVVEEIYPSDHVLPENMLRMYLYFSGPMADEDIIRNISLRRADGTLVEGAFLSNRFNLWSPDRTRLTVLFDPGRVKTGLEAHEALGRALNEGESYILSVDADAMDTFGCGLAEAFSHAFRAGPSDVDAPNPADWEMHTPNASSTEPLRILLGSAHDHLSMAFRIRVRLDGVNVRGSVALLENEAVWEFTPHRPWAAVTYEVSVGPEFEDLAGNRPGELFDQPIDLETPAPKLSLWFQPNSE